MSGYFYGRNPVIKGVGFRIYILQWAIVCFLSAGWWGIMYPNFSMTEDVFSVEESTRGESAVEDRDRNRTELFFELLKAKPEQIHIKSRLLETICGTRGNDNGTDRGSEENSDRLSGDIRGCSGKEDGEIQVRGAHRGI